MYIIDESYFIKELTIPNTVEIDVSGNSTPFEAWIDRSVRLCLQNALGSVLFADFDSNVTSGVIDGGAPAKWLELVNGKTYTNSGKSYTWKGLIFTEGTFKGSLLAQFTYAEWLKFELSRMTGMGEVTGNAVNAMNVNSTYRYVNVWNEFVKMYQGSNSTRAYTLSYKRGIPFYDYCNGDNDGFVSLIEFLRHNETDYPDANLKLYDYQNTLGI